ncbi:hypothetical protein GGI14_003170 [Coemansia sp. S680]|nr:hypothetical protein GGI14_003170 [Coemansia sp. S680]
MQWAGNLPPQPEGSLYTPIKAFFLYCAVHVQAYVDRVGVDRLPGIAGEQRLILPLERHNIVLPGSWYVLLPDITFKACAIDTTVAGQGIPDYRPHYNSIDGVVEVKKFPRDSRKAVQQLANYLRLLQE